MNTQFILIAIGSLVVAALVGGYFLATHLHSVAVKTASAITAATTLPNADVAKLNAVVSGLGDKVAANTAAVGAAVDAVVAHASAQGAAHAAAGTPPTQAPAA